MVRARSCASNGDDGGEGGGKRPVCAPVIAVADVSAATPCWAAKRETDGH